MISFTEQNALGLKLSFIIILQGKGELLAIKH